MISFLRKNETLVPKFRRKFETLVLYQKKTTNLTAKMDVETKTILYGGKLKETITLYSPAYLKSLRLKWYQRITNTYKMPQEYRDTDFGCNNNYLYSHYGVIKFCAFDMTDFRDLDDLTNLAASFLYYALFWETHLPLRSFITDLIGLTSKELARLASSINYGIYASGSVRIDTLEEALVVGFLLLTKFRSQTRNSPYLYDVLSIFMYESPLDDDQWDLAIEKMSYIGKDRDIYIHCLPPLREGDVERARNIKIIDITESDFRKSHNTNKIVLELDDFFERYDKKRREQKLKGEKLQKLRIYLRNFLKLTDAYIEYVENHGIRNLEDLRKNIEENRGLAFPASIRSEAIRDFSTPGCVRVGVSLTCNGCWLSENINNRMKYKCKIHGKLETPAIASSVPLEVPVNLVPIPSAPPASLEDVGGDAPPTPLIIENESPEEIICGICLEKKKSVVFVPCGHVVCNSAKCSGMKICHICRTPVTGTIKIYL